MGPACPLPERIPLPNDELLNMMIADGIVINQDDITTPSGDAKFVTYSLPSGWSIVDKSWRVDLPNYYIIDSCRMTRYYIHGAWKGSYDNELYISKITNPKNVDDE